MFGAYYWGMFGESYALGECLGHVWGVSRVLHKSPKRSLGKRQAAYSISPGVGQRVVFSRDMNSQ